jgi:hypothetical protein
MRTLVYKRTHVGDPDAQGQFGIHDCMGTVRDWKFDSVIGVGGIGNKPVSHSIAEKVNWIGIGPHKGRLNGRARIVTFDHFLLYDSKGPIFYKLAPQLADRMLYMNNVRKVIVDSCDDAEVRKILDLAKDAPPSSVNRVRPPTASQRCGAHTDFRKNRCRVNEAI